MHWLFTGRLSVDKITVKIAELPQSLEGIKLVQLSDFHYDGMRLSEEMLQEAIAVTNEVEPDLIVLTGDYVTDDPSPIHQLVMRLKHLQSRCGVYAVLGNHDIHYNHSQAEVTKAFTSIGVHVLWNEIAYPFGDELPVVGLADYWSREFNPIPVMQQLDPFTPRIVLSHNPDTAKILEQWRVDLQLSGHTHGGHIVIPGFGPAVFYYKKLLKQLPKKLRRWVPFWFGDCSKVVRYWEWAQGFHKVANNQLYVNRGLGTYRPGRLFCPPEVTVITLMKSEV
ncbi:metallophosphoesterase [Nostoc sp. FACHB-87]|uniref:metallophosphoesterase n=1 Tax=Nostocales TaxID=1161 RepID=UPI001687FFEC|nr:MULTISPECIES: metallophosphoesterase [Nostocales]MBD2301211.1 metallophosphoesterase [Nostoc sp. FACHB-190]MBD2456158.1 metallophosphoesterase [Nostoc sp. FACHB-87]MBD2473909.1 metallophosphoesterase [Anabaena sp. FACHB-83]MBD2490466.1 metallophosphoesterase [Aulosira sp. FACHB-615]